MSRMMTKTALCGSVAALALVIGADQGFASEPCCFEQTLRGVTMGIPLAAAPPPGLYFDLGQAYLQGPHTDLGPGLPSISATGIAWAPALIYAPGWKFLGANYSMAVIQPFVASTVWNNANVFSNNGGLSVNTGGPGVETWEQNIHATIIKPIALSWNLGQGWFAGASFAIQAPLFGRNLYGSALPDWYTYSPGAQIAYLGKDWKFQANFQYDINGASPGYAGMQNAAAALATGANGFTSGQSVYLDWSLTRKFGKWEIGPAGYFYQQVTNDTPGQGLTCAQSAAAGLGCSNQQGGVGLGGKVGYDFGPVDLSVIVTDAPLSWTKEDFSGLSIFFHTSFKLWGPEAQPMYKKAVSAAD